MLKWNLWPWGLIVAGAGILWLLGYRYTDGGAIGFMAILIAAAGGYLVLTEKRGHWK